MARINLLPWREELRRERRQQFFGLVVVFAILAVVAVLAGWWYFGQRLEYQQARNQYLERQIAALEEKIQRIEELEQVRQQLIKRQQVIEELQQDRAEMVHLFDELARTIPDGVYLTSMTQKDDVLTLKGIAESNARVSAYMRNLQNSKWLFQPELKIIERVKQEGGRLVRRFTLEVLTEPPEKKSQQKSSFEARAEAS